MKLSTVIFASMLSVGTLFAGTYNVDLDHSNVAFKVKHMMISNVTGQFNKFSGTFNYDDETKTLTSLNGEVDVNSIDTDNAKRDAHLKSVDFFDVAKYPSMQLTLDKVEGDTALVKLTMHGVTKEVKMELETSGTVIKDPWGNSRTGLSLSGKINRKDFGLNWNQVIEAGGVAVGETVKINIEIEGILAK
ncbi:YceI family protein [Sulfurovum sp. zt1-1]|uniref:YceI family protein n=1 Tax=Sulfurovum zhangzhouensis TaxID=3019067 RepID=A0ABT7QVI3_9BACT|nr:YceI family protein [Sulfurovum zhangzhouensis]MDM5270848.1 YceI family protein [Sulfurovum zhangzhouensis]